MLPENARKELQIKEVNRIAEIVDALFAYANGDDILFNKLNARIASEVMAKNAALVPCSVCNSTAPHTKGGPACISPEVAAEMIKPDAPWVNFVPVAPPTEFADSTEE
jgi:hypothetical protein